MTLQLYELPQSDKTVMRKIRIIIIDDNIMTLQLMEKWLSKKGYEVVTFSEPICCSFSEKNTDECIKENKCADIYLTDCILRAIVRRKCL